MIENHDFPDDQAITDALNKVYADQSSAPDPFLTRANWLLCKKLHDEGDRWDDDTKSEQNQSDDIINQQA